MAVETQGRHRYFRLAAADVARLLEGLMGVAQRTGATRVRPGPREPAMRKARVCYDHLAGDIAVEIYDALLRQRFIRSTRANDDKGTTIELTKRGKEFCADLNIELDGMTRSRRPMCRPCLDWSVRRFHVAGLLGGGRPSALLSAEMGETGGGIAGREVYRQRRAGAVSDVSDTTEVESFEFAVIPGFLQRADVRLDYSLN